MGKQKYKIEYKDSKGSLTKIFFVDRAFDSALKQAKAFIERNHHIKTIKSYYKDWNGKYNLGWKELRI